MWRDYPINNTRIAKMLAKIENLEQAVESLQAECPHENGKYRYAGSSGNYDPTSDAYWLNCRCSDCGRQWHVDSERDHDEYYDIPKRKGWENEPKDKAFPYGRA